MVLMHPNVSTPKCPALSPYLALMKHPRKYWQGKSYRSTLSFIGAFPTPELFMYSVIFLSFSHVVGALADLVRSGTILQFKYIHSEIYIAPLEGVKKQVLPTPWQGHMNHITIERVSESVLGSRRSSRRNSFQTFGLSTHSHTQTHTFLYRPIAAKKRTICHGSCAGKRDQEGKNPPAQQHREFGSPKPR